MKNKILSLLVLSLILSSCSNSGTSQNNPNTGNLISFQKYDFVNSAYVSSSELIIGFYTNGFTLAKTGCDSLFFDSADTVVPTGGGEKIIVGENYSANSYCFPSRIELDVTDTSQVVNGHEVYSVKILSDMYNMILE